MLGDLHINNKSGCNTYITTFIALRERKQREITRGQLYYIFSNDNLQNIWRNIKLAYLCLDFDNTSHLHASR
jgi:hypothetical protein